MRKLSVNIQNISYDIIIRNEFNDMLTYIKEVYKEKKIFVITDSNVYKLHYESLYGLLKDDYQVEVERLCAYPSTPYIGYYTVTGFSNYTLLAMYADDYNGFVYALTDNESKIIYVELIFCNYFYDLDYQTMIPNAYLPDGFNATLDNPYSKTKN